MLLLRLIVFFASSLMLIHSFLSALTFFSLSYNQLLSNKPTIKQQIYNFSIYKRKNNSIVYKTVSKIMFLSFKKFYFQTKLHYCELCAVNSSLYEDKGIQTACIHGVLRLPQKNCHQTKTIHGKKQSGAERKRMDLTTGSLFHITAFLIHC